MRGIFDKVADAPPLLVSLLVWFFGFAVLVTWWAVGGWPGLAGFFHYRSATVGDGLLLPVLAYVLLKGCKRFDNWRPPDERGWSRVGLAVGGLIGAGLQALWLIDPSPGRNWTLPHAHTFNVAGWYHAVFVIGMSALVAGLVARLAGRVRECRRALPESRVNGLAYAAATPLTLLVACSGGFAVLVTLDSTSRTDANLSTIGAVALSALVAAVLLGIAFGRSHIRTTLFAVALGLLSAAALGVGLYPWPPEPTLLIGLAAFPCVFVALAVTQPAAVNEQAAAHAAGAAATIATVLFAALAWAISQLHLHARAPFFGILVGAGVASTIAALVRPQPQADEEGDRADPPESRSARSVRGVLATRPWADIPGLWLVSFYPLMALLLAARVRLFANGQAATAVNVADTAFDVMVFSLFRSRFRALIFREDLQDREEEHPGYRDSVTRAERLERRVGDGVLQQLFMLGLAVIASLLVLVGYAALPLGFESVAGRHPVSWLELGLDEVAFAVAAVIVFAAYRIARRDARLKDQVSENTAGKRVFDLPRGAAVLLAVASLLWAIPPWLLGGTAQFVPEAAFVAIIAAALATEALISDAVWLHVLDVPRRVIGAAVLFGIAVGSQVYWLLSTVLWAGDGPAPTGRLGAAALVILLSWVVLQTLSGHTLAWPRPDLKRDTARRFSRQSVKDNMFQDAILYAALVLFAGVVPLYAVGRFEALDSSSLAVVASFVFVPGFVGAILWALDNNLEHLRRETALAADLPRFKRQIGDTNVPELLPPRTVRERAKETGEDAVTLEKKRVTRLGRHIGFQSLAGRALVYIAVVGFIGVHLLGLD